MPKLQLALFEAKKQIFSFTFLAVILLLTVFAITQIGEVFHLPVHSESDIAALNQSGERNFIFIPNSDEIQKEQSIHFLQQRIDEGTVSGETAKELDSVITLLADGKYTFDDVFSVAKDNEAAFPWLCACKAQFSNRFGTVEEVNHTMHLSLGNRGYTPMFYAKYTTYMQIVVSLLLFAIILLMITRDYKHNMFEVLYAQPYSPIKYILSRFFGAFVPLAIYLYLFGVIFNLISAIRFVGAGYEYQYTAFFPYFILYLLPTIFFFSSLVMVLMLLINKAVAVFPIYCIYFVLNITPAMFNLDETWFRYISPIMRLDDAFVNDPMFVLLNRFVYLTIGVILLITGCFIYKRLRGNLRKVITI